MTLEELIDACDIYEIVHCGDQNWRVRCSDDDSYKYATGSTVREAVENLYKKLQILKELE